MLKCYVFEADEDKWNWVHDSSGIFSVSSARKLLLSKLENVEKTKNFQWSKWVPLKVSNFSWKLKLNKIPVRSNLASRGIHIPDTHRPLCSLEDETTDHVFVKCPMAAEVWSRVSWWSDVRWYAANNVKELFDVAAQSGGSKELLNLKTTILYSTLWFIWNARNNKVFRMQSIYIDSILMIVSRRSSHGLLTEQSTSRCVGKTGVAPPCHVFLNFVCSIF
ncbi:putative reverse transcriptase zinc-binding domain-containing protein [Helianthus annuus]|nr:putative reverse transcriptase zinc-binding domain-containing protein [Helianthus annuus]